MPTVTGPLRRRDAVHATEALIARTHTTRRLKFTLPGPMTIADTIADAHYGDRTALAMAFAEVLNEEARDLAALGVDVIQFDEPAFNVYLDDVVGWGIEALHRAADGCRAAPRCISATATASRPISSGSTALGREWRQYERIFPALAASRIDQVSLECANSHVPIELLGLLAGKDVLVGAIDVASDEAETPEQVAATIEQALRYVPPERLFPCTNCGMAPLDRTLANQKLAALAAGAALVRGRPASAAPGRIDPGYRPRESRPS